MQKYFLKKYTPVYKAGDRICIGFAQRKSSYFEIASSDENIRKINAAIEKGISDSDLSLPLYSDLLLNDLLEEANYRAIETINRAELFLQYLGVPNLSEEVRQSKILIFGCGAGGATITYMLAQIGFTNLIVVDDDTVGKSDVDRLTVFDNNDIGCLKTDAIAGKIERNFGNKVKTVAKQFIHYADLEKIINLTDPDFIIKACDPDLIFRINLNKLCFQKHIPFYMMAYSFELLRLGPLLVPGFTGCDDRINQMQKKAYGEHYDFQTDEKLFTQHLVHPAISYNINMLASFSFKEVLFFLSKKYEYCFTIGRLVEFNPLSLHFSHFEIVCDNSCKICGGFSEVIN